LTNPGIRKASHGYITFVTVFQALQSLLPGNILVLTIRFFPGIQVKGFTCAV
jgi:hypothetical protein